MTDNVPIYTATDGAKFDNEKMKNLYDGWLSHNPNIAADDIEECWLNYLFNIVMTSKHV